MAQADTPIPRYFVSDGSPRYFAVAPVATITASASTSIVPSTVTLNGRDEKSTSDTEPHTLGNMSLSSFGGGSAMLGLPGDFTPPSRFVRAAFFQNTAPQKPNAEGSVFTAFHILGSMEIPIGAQFAVGEAPADIPSATQCTCVSDMSGLRFYYRSMYDGGIRCIDLKEIDFKKIGLKSEPLIPSRKEFVHYIRF